MVDNPCRLGPVELAPGVRPLHAGSFLFAAFIGISLTTFISVIQPYVLTVQIDLAVDKQGQVSGDMVFYSEIVVLLLSAAVGTLADRFGRRGIFAVGALILGIGYSLFGYVDSVTTLTAARIFLAFGIAIVNVLVQAVQAELPLYWRRTPSGDFERRHFDQWLAIDASRAMQHVSWYEADAFARWAGRRLPTEAEWEMAAADWNGEQASFDWRGGGPADVNAFAGTDTPQGCRQMMGNVWEWTSSTFAPYPGFVADMYEDYSQTSFHTRKVLRGGSWATRSRMMRPSLRNFFQLSRRDVYSGLRTCVQDS